MNISVPLTAAGEFAVHFGAAAKAALFTIDETHRRIVRIDTVEPPARLPCSWADWLGARGVKVLLAGAISAGAQQRMAAAGIDVVAGVRPDDPILLVQSWLTRSATPGPNRCESEMLPVPGRVSRRPVGPHELAPAACCCLVGLTRSRDGAAPHLR